MARITKINKKPLFLCVFALVCVGIWVAYSAIDGDKNHPDVDTRRLLQQNADYRQNQMVLPVEPAEVQLSLTTEASTTNRPKDDLTLLLDRVAMHSESDKYKSVVITVVDKQYYDIARNFFIFINKLKLKNVLAVSLDKDTHERLTNAGISSLYDSSVENATKSYTTFLSSGFKVKSAIKMKMLKRVLNLGYAVLMTDVDVIFLKDPFDYLQCSKCDFEMSDNLPPHISRKNSSDTDSDTMCIGFFYTRPTQNTVRLISDVYDSVRIDTTLWDQVEFNRLARHAISKGQLTMRILDYDLFPAGDPFFFDHYLTPYPYSKAVIFHNSWMNNVVEKTYRAREMGLWLLDHDGYYTNEHALYMTYDNPLPELRYMEWRVFETAMKLAKILGRILIIPKFTCPPNSQKNGWPIDCRYRPIGQCFCSLTELVNVKHTAILNYHPWREHVFLSHPLVPPTVKESPSQLYVIENELTHKYPGIHNGVYMTFHPNDPLRGATKDEIMNWFRGKHPTVLRFRALYGNFWI